MSDTLALTGQLSVTPDQSQTDATLSGDFAVTVPLAYTLTLSGKESQTLTLPIPSGPEPGTPQYQTVNIDGIGGEASFLFVRTTVPTLAKISNGTNNDQIVAFDSLLVLSCATLTLTALSLAATSISAGAGVARIVAGVV